jgi:hypothetical protein
MGSKCVNKAIAYEEKTDDGMIVIEIDNQEPKVKKQPEYGYRGSNHGMLIKSGHRHHHSSSYFKRRH